MSPNRLRLIVQHLRTLAAAQEECEEESWDAVRDEWTRRHDQSVRFWLERGCSLAKATSEAQKDTEAWMASRKRDAARAKHDAAKGGKVDG